MARLPNSSECHVSDLKLFGYQLNPAHTEGSSKAKFLEYFGFNRTTPELLRAALLAHALVKDLADWRTTELGTIFEIDGQLPSPDGRNPMVRTVWMIETNDERRRFVTLVPLDFEP